MKKLLMIMIVAMMATSVQAQTRTAYLDLYQRGGGKHLRTTLMVDDRPIYLGKKNLGEMLNILSDLGWKVDHTLIGANRIMFFPTRHKFHIILKKEYVAGEDPFIGLLLTENVGFENVEGQLQIEKLPPIVPKIAATTINYTAYKNKAISVNINNDPDFLSNDYVGEQGVLTFKNSITRITNKAFFGCSDLDSVIIPESVVEIGDSAFSKCWYLKNFFCQSTVPPVLGKKVFFSIPDLVIYVPQESVDAYKSADGWKYYASKIVGYNFN